MPAVFCLDKNLEEVAPFLDALRRRLTRPPISGNRALARRFLERGKRAGAPKWIAPYIDFVSIEEITPTAALILAAEYDRARRLWPKGEHPQPLYVVEPEKWNINVLNTLLDLGFLQILGLASGAGPNSAHQQTILQFRSGKKNDPEKREELLDAMEKLLDVLNIDPGAACFELSGALGEAMENVVSRAYPQGAIYPVRHVERWWMTGAVDRERHTMSVAIFDQGISIPVSLEKWQLFAGFKERLRSLFGLEHDPSDPSYDGRVIEAAISEAVSVTNQPQNGKGLGQIQRFVDSCDEGRLRIISRNGVYEYRKGGAKRLHSLTASIGGTLIEWEVTVSPKVSIEVLQQDAATL